MLRFGVLGLLIERRGYGYQLVQRLSQRLGHAWQLKTSAVYAALYQLEEAGLVEAAPGGRAPSEGAPCEGAEELAPPAASARPARREARLVYEVTDAGIREFQAWLARPSMSTSPIRSELALKVALAGPDNVLPLLASIAHEEWAIVHSLSNQRQASGVAGSQSSRATSPIKLAPLELPWLDSPGDPCELAAGTWPATATALVAAAAAARLQGELAWLEIARATLQRMTAQQVAAAGQVALPGAPSLS